MKRVIIVGGGIAGLSCAYALRNEAQVTVVERDRIGGVIRTVREGGFTIEGGPDSFITQKPWALALCKELGLEDRLIPTKARKLYVLSGGDLHELPEGVMLTVPTRVKPLLKSKLISWRGKLRMGLDLILPRGNDEDESLGAFVRRRFGREALEKIAEPLMAGIFCADADRLSLKTTFPRFAEMEKEHRSLIKAMRKIVPTGKSPFLALRGGMSELVDRLVERMPNVKFVTGEADRVEARRVHAGGWIEADAVVLATPGPVAARLVGGGLGEAIAKIAHVSTATVSLGYRTSDVPRTLDATGFVIPRGEGRKILACTWTSSKFEDRAPEGHVLMRAFVVGEPADPLSIAREELRAILGITAEPAVAKSFVWRGANPIYEVGHEKRVREIESLLPDGLHLTGSAYRGIGLPDCIRDGTAVARQVLAGR